MPLEITSSFTAKFGQAPEVVTRAPGRLEILGNHTDYNEGVVLSVAVDRTNTFAARAVAGTVCTVYDLQSQETRQFDVANLGAAVPRDWANYIKGTVVELQQRGVTVPAFQGMILGNVPLSAGMSSSAAFEMAVALALTRLARTELPWLELAKVGQACENHYVGAKTGLLDQFSSLKGKANMLVFSDFRSYEVCNSPLPAGVALVVANCMVKHHLTNEYNDRRADCEAAAARLAQFYPGVKTLRDVSMAQLTAAQGKLERRVFLRAKHVVGECERVYAGCQALAAGDVQAFGRLMSESHESSRLNFENSCAELDVLVELAAALPGFLGGRLSGGGFGGITVNLVEAAQAELFAARLGEAYQLRSGRHSEILICRAGDGARVLAG